MARQLSASVDNTFVKGVITEATGLNFPDHACTAADNVVFSILGNVERRPGLDLETNYSNFTLSRTGLALSSYLWKNAGGDGLTQVYVVQIGNSILFYQSSLATLATPLSATKLNASLNLTNYIALNNVDDPSKVECQYAEGNGYLFIFHPDLDPIYCTFSSGSITALRIAVNVRDTSGVPEPGVADNFRPNTLSTVHNYNLYNQGWTNSPSWATTSTTVLTSTNTGSHTWTIPSGLSITVGDPVVLTGLAQGGDAIHMSGLVTAYSGTSLTINISFTSLLVNPLNVDQGIWSLSKTGGAIISTFQSAVGYWPSNSDVWWTFKDTSRVYNPAVTYPNVTLNQAPAPKGALIYSAFNLAYGTTGLTGLTSVSTVKRPRTGCWFQGRVWYTGVDSSFTATGTADSYSWSENIYFSQIIQNTSQFGKCYQSNDPTSEAASDLLPSDGGIIRIQGCGAIYKLFPIQNGLLVFAANGIRFITGSTGIGFTANDYTITELPNIRSISSTSFINVNGYPVFWNEEGIYSITPAQQGGFSVDNLCLGTILTLYSDIPTISKRSARGDYDPLSYTIKWAYRDTTETDLSTRYEFNKILTYNTATKAFYTDTIGSANGAVYIHDIKYIIGLGDGVAAESTLKYLTSVSRLAFAFAEEKDTTNWVDFVSLGGGGTKLTSTFTTGYKLKGGALRRWEPVYIYVYTQGPCSYTIQGVWDYAISGNSGRYSQTQIFTNNDPNYAVSIRRHKIRGHGKSLQLKFTSVAGQPMNIIGWAIMESSNASI